MATFDGLEIVFQGSDFLHEHPPGDIGVGRLGILNKAAKRANGPLSRDGARFRQPPDPLQHVVPKSCHQHFKDQALEAFAFSLFRRLANYFNDAGEGS
ncbi:hypothetical protein L0938_13730 [Paracidovorax citrulli]